ncbi:MAG: hypothetical protein RLY31_2580 [Bacteroidota bacterium]|jgi:hypothetical protein
MKTLIFVIGTTLLVQGCLLWSNGGNSGKVTAVVEDFEGTEGCGRLLRLSDGRLLEPERPGAVTAIPVGTTVRLVYRERSDGVPRCLLADARVVVSRLKVMPSPDLTAGDCADTVNPFEVPWMDRAIDRVNATRIVKYKLGSRWAYLFESVPVSYLFDCEGEVICETKGDPQDECHIQYLQRLSKGKIIWQGEGIWD